MKKGVDVVFLDLHVMAQCVLFELFLEEVLGVQDEDLAMARWNGAK